MRLNVRYVNRKILPVVLRSPAAGTPSLLLLVGKEGSFMDMRDLGNLPSPPSRLVSQWSIHGSTYVQHVLLLYQELKQYTECAMHHLRASSSCLYENSSEEESLE